MKRQGLLNPDKADLDNDGQLSSYEEARGKAIERNMKGMGGLLDDERERYAEGTPERKEDKLTQDSFMQMIANAATQQGLGPAEYKQQIGRKYAQEQLGEVSDETEEHIRQFAVGDIGQEDFFKYFIRDAKAFGGLASKLARLISRKDRLNKELREPIGTKKQREISSEIKMTDEEIESLQKQIDGGSGAEAKAALEGEMSDIANRLRARGFSDDRIQELLDEAYEYRNPSELEEALQMPRIEKQEGGPMETQMSMLMDQPEITSDDEMEENYIDFIMDEALDDDEQDFLMNELRGNDRLSEVFDKVIEVASEFSGSGPVEGPGSGVSDSIPARLSDGEFVFTAKATEEIGESELMRMMKDAEARADGRQTMANGGNVEEEETVTMPVAEQAPQQDIRVTKETVGAQAGMQEQSDLVDEELKKSMLSTRPYVRS